MAKKNQPAVGWNGVIHVLAHGFPGATLHPAKAKEHNSMRFTKFRQEPGPQESGQDAVMVSFFWHRDGAMKLIRCRDGVF